VYWQDNANGRGRPKRSWHLSDKAFVRFPDSHSELTLTLIDSVTELFGEQGLNQLIDKREKQLLKTYSQAMVAGKGLQEKLSILVQLRSQEGYMAEVRALENGDFMLLEHHCPICAAARRCQGFCRPELKLLEQVLGPNIQVNREQYLLAGDLRCSYRISPNG